MAATMADNSMGCMPELSYATEPASVEEMRIMFADKSLLHLQIVGGVQSASADEVVSFVVEEMNLGEDARNMFALWIMSPSLELQLKPGHVVFQVLNQWAILLDKYGESSSPETNIWSAGGFLDEIPIVVFRRNVFFPIEKEKILVCRSDFPQKARHLLYAEAAQNMICGRCVSGDPLKYHELAGLRATIEYGRYDEENHVDAFYEDKIHLLYPEHIITWKNGVAGSSVMKWLTTGPCAASLKKKFIEEARMAHRNVVAGPYGSFTDTECQQRYLSICSELPIYASAFYTAKLRLLGRLWGYNEVSVLVAINGYGVCVLNESDMSLLTALSYRYMTPILDHDSNSLHLKFTTRQGSSPPSALSSDIKRHEFVLIRDIHLVSKQVALMDALIKTFTMLYDAKSRKSSAPTSFAHVQNAEKRAALMATEARVTGQQAPPSMERQTSRREQQFWTNKYKALRLPSFRKGGIKIKRKPPPPNNKAETDL